MQKIRGYIHALPKKSAKEEACRVAVITDDGTEYQVLHKGPGIGLVSNINANVEVEGEILTLRSDEDETENAIKALSVRSFQLTDGFDDPWYDDTVS